MSDQQQESEMRYPTRCLSAYCGEISSSQRCKECKGRPALDEYRRATMHEYQCGCFKDAGTEKPHYYHHNCVNCCHP